MVRVLLSGNLRRFTGGASEFDIEAATIAALFRELGERHPALAPHLAEGVAVAIDGQIYQDTLFQALPGDAEVHILPQIAGG